MIPWLRLLASLCAVFLLPAPAAAAFNHLKDETSPYLLEHRANPIDWYPWGDAALGRARAEDRPIFLSIGYSACHWCHVMERESFEDADVAAVLNSRFVPIKVDREERPEIDRIYMAAVVIMAGNGGWPLSVFLAPDLRPFFGATYVPRDRFLDLLRSVAASWDGKRPAILKTAGAIQRELETQLRGGVEPGALEPAARLRERAVSELRASFDRRDGGFGPAPKFPPSGALQILLDQHAASGDPGALDMAVRTLAAMARGGFYDVLGGGFHRYSTDARWFAPHFEKMLCDSALLAPLYLEAWRQTGRGDLKAAGTATLDWAIRDMKAPEGGFYSSLDADSEGEEGRYYLWTAAEVRALLDPDQTRAVDDFYGVTEKGNFAAGRNILHATSEVKEYAAKRGVPAARAAAVLDAARGRLLEARERRARPHRDEKILTSWNGLMISALARGAALTGERRYLEAARGAARFAVEKVMSPDGALRASFTSGRPGPAGFLDDYAFMARGMLDLYDATADAAWLRHASAIVAAAGRFRDEASGRYAFTSAEHKDLIVRPQELEDGSVPSGSGVLAETMLRLAAKGAGGGLRDEAVRTLRLAGGALQRAPVAYASMIGAAARLDEAPSIAAPATAGAAAAGGALITGTIVGRANPQKVVEATTAAPAGPVRPGQSVTLSVRLAIADGWHVNSNHPTLDYLIPTKVTLPAPEQASIDSIDYPPGEMVSLEFVKEKLSVYEKEATIRVSLRPSPGAGVRLRVGYQACSNRTCLAPETQELVVPMTIEGEPVQVAPPSGAAGAAESAPGAAGAASGVSADPAGAGGNAIALLLARRGLLALLGVVFLAGLALDLTPCVYPLVPVTISFFAAQEATSWGRRTALPALYVLGMALTYSALGVAAGVSGTVFGATLQNPWIVLALVALFVVMALSMFGLFELRLPGFMTRVGGGRRGFAGALVMGLTVGIVAAPCIGPFVVTLLAFVGASGKPVLGFWLFFVLALGMGLPFLVLGVFSGALAALPRSGGWLIYAKKVMGVGLLALALYFLQPFLGDRALGGIVLAFAAIAAVYLALLERTRMAAAWFPFLRAAVGVAVLAGGVLVAVPLLHARPEADWRPYDPAAFDRARGDGRPIVVDFFADWCLPCKELDRATFSDPRVLEALRPFALFKADLTRFESEEVRGVRDRFRVIGVPTIVLVDAAGNEHAELRLYGFEDVPSFLARLEKVRAASP